MYENLKIVIVDNESLMLEMLGTHFSELKVPTKNIIKVTSGEAAITYHNRNKDIDITFLDIEMPGMNGFETLIKIKEINPTAYIVMLSGSSTFNNVTQALNSGASSFIAKPYNRNKIIKALKAYLAKRDE